MIFFQLYLLKILKCLNLNLNLLQIGIKINIGVIN